MTREMLDMLTEAAAEAARMQERAAVVAYLAKRGLIGAAEGVREGDHRIERGEHRTQEET